MRNEVKIAIVIVVVVIVVVCAARRRQNFEFSVAPNVNISPEVQRVIRTTSPKSTRIEGGRTGTMCYCADPLKQDECPNGVDCFNFDHLMGDSKTLNYQTADALAKFFCAYLKKNAHDLSKRGITLRSSPARKEDEILSFFAGKPVTRQGSMFVGNCTQPYRPRYYSYA